MLLLVRHMRSSPLLANTGRTDQFMVIGIFSSKRQAKVSGNGEEHFLELRAQSAQWGKAAKFPKNRTSRQVQINDQVMPPYCRMPSRKINRRSRI